MAGSEDTTFGVIAPTSLRQAACRDMTSDTVAPSEGGAVRCGVVSKDARGCDGPTLRSDGQTGVQSKSTV
jgi:hypothetical protein